MRLTAGNTRLVVIALGTAQTIAWGSTYYLPAVLATPMARDLGLSPVWVFAAFSAAMVLSAFVGPPAGRAIDARGGRSILILSSFVFAAGLAGLGLAQGPVSLFAAWFVIGTGMGMGLYEAAFSTLAGIYGKDARPSITGITLIAGFASTVGWPLSGALEAAIGWRGACFTWAAIHMLIALPLNILLPVGTKTRAPAPSTSTAGASTDGTAPTPSHEVVEPPSILAIAALAYVFAATWFASTAMAAHLPRLLEAAGATTAMAITAGALIGPAQVGARVLEYGLLQRFHPLLSARIAAAAHPVGAMVLLIFGGPAAYAFTLLHGAGNGVLTIAKGTLPLALFGPVGYGARQGLLNAPARALQAIAPLVFGFALEAWGANAIWLTAGLGMSATVVLLMLKGR
jgi:MFS family permease